ncbi:unknown [Anaerotruncus sp. CAG:390]|nr:unknown [Anaerotruncus sp. CAG:390]
MSVVKVGGIDYGITVLIIVNVVVALYPEADMRTGSADKMNDAVGDLDGELNIVALVGLDNGALRKPREFILDGKPAVLRKKLIQGGNGGADRI